MELDITPAMVVLPALRLSLTTLTVLALPLAASAQESSLQDLGDALVAPPPPAVIYSAQEIVTLDPARPSVAAVAVAGDRILATGSLDQVIVPGLIAQHDHPLLTGLTMTSEIIAIEDWVLPQGTAKAARNRSEYLQRLKAANDRMQDPNALLLTWEFHQYFHGQLRKADLDAISSTEVRANGSIACRPARVSKLIMPMPITGSRGYSPYCRSSVRPLPPPSASRPA
jgi:hypothetical protein